MAENGTTRDDDRLTGAAARPEPAQGPVIESRLLDPDAKPNAVEEPLPPIESALLGVGDGQAARRRDGAAVEDAVLADSPSLTPAAHGGSAYEPPHSPPAPVMVEQQRGGFWPMVLGGVVAAGLGAGALWWAAPRLSDPGDAAAVGRAAVTETAAAAARAEIEAARPALIEAAREEALAARPEVAASPADLAPRLDALEARLAAPGEGVAPVTDGAAQTRLSDLEAEVARIGSALATPARIAPPGAPPLPVVDPAEVAALRAGLDAQAAQIEALAARPVIDPAAAEELRAMAASASETAARIEALAAQVGTQLAEAQAQGAELAAQQGRIAAEVAATAQRAETAAAVARLETALAEGGSTAEAAAALDAAGVETPALPAEIPSLAALRAGWDDAARAGLAAAREAGAETSSGGGFAGFLRAQTGARSVAPREGGDADAILSRAGAAVTQGDIPAALAELQALPEPAQAAMADWIAQAQARAAAEAAAGSLQNQP
ncbi:hypothetical protein GI374_04135 [Paracoccus sp. S-4012]|uniref:hypothetical protein n=1 Tax=Paracoccus sp. S-4012 TaxID=2665648 RepID=UPI0012AFF128|nr:hypothetical protein [Paracoccus sp. S-4012]MRX49647.1 hypothetical protein [Paracoccus sp. S-4012]